MNKKVFAAGVISVIGILIYFGLVFANKIGDFEGKDGIKYALFVLIFGVVYIYKGIKDSQDKYINFSAILTIISFVILLILFISHPEGPTGIDLIAVMIYFAAIVELIIGVLRESKEN